MPASKPSAAVAVIAVGEPGARACPIVIEGRNARVGLPERDSVRTLSSGKPMVELDRGNGFESRVLANDATIVFRVPIPL